MSDKYKNLKIPIKGMHCRSCEILLEEQLKEVQNVYDVKANYRRGEVIVYYEEEKPLTNSLHEKIVEAGYLLGSAEKLPLIIKNKKEYQNLLIAFIFLLIFFLLFKKFNLLNLDFDYDLDNPSFLMAILIGLVAGFSTCMALIGGLSLGLSAKFAKEHPSASTIEKFRPHLFFVVGRIFSYALLGGCLGLLGKAFRFSFFANGILIIIVGLVMLIMGVQLTNIFPRLSNFKITLPKKISKIFGTTKNSNHYSHIQASILGALTFFLPCGFSQTMQIYAISTGDFWLSFWTMGLFALGTAPGLLGIGGLTSLVKGAFKKRFFKFAGLAVIFFALFNLSNGYRLLSLGFDYSSKTEQKTELNIPLEDGVQIIRMIEGRNGYTPNNFSVKKGVPVRWIIDAQAPYSCASSIIVPKLRIEKRLKLGENIIEFTPQESGKLPFSCSMGMYNGAFNVVGDNNIIEDKGQIKTDSSNSFCSPKSLNSDCSSDENSLQLIKTSYTLVEDIQPNRFTVKVGQPVRLEIEVKEDGLGCMEQIEIPGLYDRPQPLIAGKKVIMEFTPQNTGKYLITCAMGIVRGWLIVQ